MEDKGPFEGGVQSEPYRPRDRAAAIVVAIGIIFGITLLILVLPPISILDNGSGDGGQGPVTSQRNDEMPAPPEGFEAISSLIELDTADPVAPNTHPRLTVSLSVPVSEDELVVLFSYDGNSWERLGEALPLADGSAVQADVTVLPDNVAAFRAVELTRTIIGTLPAGGSLDAAARNALATVNIAGLRPGADGSLIGSIPANDLGIPVAPSITATTAADVDTVNAILTDTLLRDAHVEALVSLTNSGNYAGIDLDYRTIETTNGPDFTAFVEALAAGLRRENKTLTITLPAPVQDGGGWNTFGFDWEALGAVATAIKIVPVADQDSYFGDMDAALGYVTSNVVSSKLLLSIDPYSHERGVDGVQSLTLTEALALASTPVTRPEGSVEAGETLVALGLNLSGETGASGLAWDDTARAVAFSYTGPGGARVVWLTNEFSEAFKLDLARRYQLGGVAVSDVSEQAASARIWPVISKFADTGEVFLVKPNGALLNPRWEVSGGSLESAAGPVVTWQAPDEPGTYTLTLIVSDGVVQVGQELNVPVEAAQVVAP